MSEQITDGTDKKKKKLQFSFELISVGWVLHFAKRNAKPDRKTEFTKEQGPFSKYSS